MKTVILGDTHGRDCWKQIVASESPNRVIFIGDYFDSFDNTAVEQMYNFQEIIDGVRDDNNWDRKTAEAWFVDICIKHNKGENETKKFTAVSSNSTSN